MTWDKMCKELIAQNKMAQKGWRDNVYIFMLGDVVKLYDDGHVTDYQMRSKDMISCEWEIWADNDLEYSELEIEFAKASLVLGFEYITRDQYGVVTLWKRPPVKTDNGWYRELKCETTTCDYKMFSNVRWEDYSPTKIKDIVNNGLR